MRHFFRYLAAFALLLGLAAPLFAIDDDISPPQQTLAKGATGTIKIRFGVPAVAAEQVTLDQTDPTLCTVPSFVTIAAGASGADLDFVCNHAGTGSIVATLPASRGGRTFALSVTVIEKSALFLDRLFVSLPYGGSSTINATIDPLPPVPVTLLLQTSVPGIVDVPAIVTVGIDGKGVIPIRAAGIGNSRVIVSLPEINGGMTTDFTVVVAPPSGLTITNVIPSHGAGTGGDNITLSGIDFTGHCAVTFGAVPARKVISQNATSITVTTPAREQGGLVDLGIRCGTKSAILPNGFSFDPSHPLVSTVGPSTGTKLGGSFVILRGTYFSADSCTVRFGDTPVPVVFTEGTESLQVVSPPHAVGTVNVSLVCGTAVVTIPNAFQYVNFDDTQAKRTTFIPTTFPQGALIGEYDGGPYRLDDQLLFNGVAADAFTTTSINTHRFWLPEYTGNVEVKLRDYAGRTMVRTFTLTEPEKPTITQIPSAITFGSEFTVTGTSFRRGLTYSLGAALLQPVSMTNTSAVFRAPVSVGTGTKTFTISDKGAAVATATVNIQSSGPNLSIVMPPCAAPEGGTLVTLYGNGFDENAMVQFGTTLPAEFTVVNHFTIQAKVPQWYGNAHPQITVFNPDGSSATLTNAFAYKSAADGGCGATPVIGRHRAAGR